MHVQMKESMKVLCGTESQLETKQLTLIIHGLVFKNFVLFSFVIISIDICNSFLRGTCNCRAMNARVMVCEIHICTWVYSKEDTMAHTRRLIVIS